MIQVLVIIALEMTEGMVAVVVVFIQFSNELRQL